MECYECGAPLSGQTCALCKIEWGDRKLSQSLVGNFLDCPIDSRLSETEFAKLRAILANLPLLNVSASRAQMARRSGYEYREPEQFERRHLKTLAAFNKNIGQASPPNRQTGGLDTTPVFLKPSQAKLNAAIADLMEALENIDPLPNGVFSKRADLLAKDVCNAGHTKAAAQWAIQSLIDDGVLDKEINLWGGVISDGPECGADSQTQVPSEASVGGAATEQRRLSFDNFKVVFQLDKERKLFPESWAESDLRLSDVRMVLNAHYNRRDSQGFSPVPDMVGAADSRLQQLRVAAVKCGLIPSGAELLPESVKLIANRLIELGTVATSAKAENLNIDVATAALQAGGQGTGERAEANSESGGAGGASTKRAPRKRKAGGRKPEPLTKEEKDVKRLWDSGDYARHNDLDEHLRKEWGYVKKVLDRISAKERRTAARSTKPTK